MVKITDRKKHLQDLNSIYADALVRRPKKSDSWLNSSNLNLEFLSSLEKHNFLKLENLYLDKLSRIKVLVQESFENVELVQLPRKVPLTKSKLKNLTVEDLESVEKLSLEEFKKGSSYWRNVTSSISLKSPLLHIPEILDIVLDPRIVRLAQEYLGGFPALTYLKVTKTWANDLPDFDTQMWHVDFDSKKMLKLFIFMHEINQERGGTRFVLGSHLFHPGRNYELQDRWTEEEVSDLFPSQMIKTVTGNFGDAFFLDTNLLHRGVKPISQDRSVIIANFAIHEETMSNGDLVFDKNYLVKLNPTQREVLTLT